MPSLASAELLTRAKATPDLVELPARRALVIDGAGAPDAVEFERSLQALYGITYTLKFDRKHAGRGDIPISPLEGDWWLDGVIGDPSADPTKWRWRLRIMVPNDITPSEVQDAVEKVTTKKGGKLFGSVEATRVLLDRLPRKRYGRILHVGPYATEKESFARLEALLAEHGLRREPWHTEIYLSDPRRTKPEKLRTVLLVRIASVPHKG
jgi:hypothetical protein